MLRSRHGRLRRRGPRRRCGGARDAVGRRRRAFENRPDAAVVDEPFYAVYLAATGADHPMRAEVLASQPTDWHEVVTGLVGPVPDGRSVFYQKHMTHHMLPAIGREWTARVRNAFLIRAPEDVLLSYTEVRGQGTLNDIGVPQQLELFEREADRLGHAPPVVDSYDVLTDPRGVLGALCKAVGTAFSDRMLSWPAGRRASDGVWAPAWYAAVERSTGFSAPRERARLEDLPDDPKRVAEAARPAYARLARFRLGGSAD